MKKEELKDEIIDDEILDDEIVDDEVIDDDVIDDIDDEEEKPQKKKSKKQAKTEKNAAFLINHSARKLKLKIALGVTIPVIAIVTVVLILGNMFLGWFKPVNNQKFDFEGDPDFTLVLKDYQDAPSATIAASVKYDIIGILEDDSYTDAQKAAAAVLFTTGNECFVDQYSYIRYQIGSTKLKDNEGTLIYQRTRREVNKEGEKMKNDVTLKLPVNHTFGNTEVIFVANAATRYVTGGKYYKITASNDDIHVNNETGFLEVANSAWIKSSPWEKEDNLYYGSSDFTAMDQKKIQLDVGYLDETIEDSEIKADLIDADSVVIEQKDGYYSVYFEADLEAANNDRYTTDALNNDNSGKDMQYTKLNVTLEIWDCGLTKCMTIDEGWSGSVGQSLVGGMGVWYDGNASAKSTIVYSYSDADCKECTTAESLRKSFS